MRLRPTTQPDHDWAATEVPRASGQPPTAAQRTSLEPCLSVAVVTFKRCPPWVMHFFSIVFAGSGRADHRGRGQGSGRSPDRVSGRRALMPTPVIGAPSAGGEDQAPAEVSRPW